MAQKTIPQKIEKEIRDYVDVLKKENLPIKSVYLFGSYAKGTGRKWSDIDVCIVSPQFSDFFDALQYLWARRIRNSSIEPIGMTPEDFADDTTLNREIKQTGIKIPLSPCP